MSSQEPRYTVRVSAELRRLRRGLPSVPEPCAADTTVAAGPPAAPAPASPVEPDLEGTGRPAARFGQLLRLRRDGRRPVVFEGLPLVSFTARGAMLAPDEAAMVKGGASDGGEGMDGDVCDHREVGPNCDAAGVAEQTLSLFLARDGRVFAQLRFLVPEHSAARPVHRVAEVGSREDLQRFLAAHRPEDALWLDARASMNGGGRWRVAALNNLRANFARVTKPLRDSFGECQI